MRTVVALILGLASACTRASSYRCDQDADCARGGVTGRCEPVGACSYPSTTCASGWAFDESADQAGACVPSDLPGVDAAVGADPPDGPGTLQLLMITFERLDAPPPIAQPTVGWRVLARAVGDPAGSWAEVGETAPPPQLCDVVHWADALDGDGRPEALVRCWDTVFVARLTPDDHGGLRGQAPLRLDVPGGNTERASVDWLDVDADGDLDVVRGHPALAVHEHGPDARFPLQDPPVAAGAHGVAAGNWDDDPELELATASADGLAVRDRVAGAWQAPIVIARDLPYVRAMLWCDHRGDAHPELITVDYDAIRLFANRERAAADGSWLDGTSPLVLGGPTGDAWGPLACGDLDGDGGDDLVIRTFDKLVIVPHGTAGQVVLAERPVPAGFALADVDDDGRLDLLTTPSVAPWRVEVRLNRSQPGSFQLDPPTTLVTTTDVPLTLSVTRAPRPTVPPI